MSQSQYLWIPILGGLFGFVYAFGIGANDVANAFATSVSSKSITLKQAVIIASIFEFAGAMFLGASVTSTVRGKIFDTDVYEDEPEIVMLGMLTSLMVATFMLLGATYFGLPVSTTHTIIGCIIGFSVAAKGFSSINWDETKNIFISWVAAPLVTGAFAFCIFGLIRYFILLSANPFTRGYYAFSFILFATIGIDIFFIFNKGTKNFTHFQEEVYDTKWVVPTSFGIGAFFGILWLWPVGPLVKKKLDAKKSTNSENKKRSKDSTISEVAESDRIEIGEINNEDVEDGVVKAEEMTAQKPGDAIVEAGVPMQHGAVGEKKTFKERFAEATYKQNLEQQSFDESKRAKECWDNAASYDSDVEQLFTFVQVFTASLSSFAHGANDIANAIAPVAAVISIYQTGDLGSKSPVPKWILGYGGVGLVLGLLIYGYKVMKTIGYKLTALSPSRGSSAELASSLMVVTASYMGIPVSTTQCIVGAVSGIGLVEGYKNVQWLQLAKVCISWVLVFFVASILSAGLFSFCAYSPSIVP